MKRNEEMLFALSSSELQQVIWYATHELDILAAADLSEDQFAVFKFLVEREIDLSGIDEANDLQWQIDGLI